jgi:hypothetical protein
MGRLFQSNLAIILLDMRGFIWLVLALLLFLAWVGSYIVYHVAGFLTHLLLVFALISVLIHVFSEIRQPPRD